MNQVNATEDRLRSEIESLKRQFGCSMVTRIAEHNEIEVPSVGDRPPRMMRQRPARRHVARVRRETRPGAALRVRVISGGCAGMEYKFEPDFSPPDDGPGSDDN